ncbi:cell division protein FtsZ [Halorubraceae archaeon YAN]|nr:cell division protein FtsZ [Halorubraceae archaeon YAN]
MRIHAIGIGGAGCRVVNTLAGEHGGRSFLNGAVAFDTDVNTLEQLSAIDPEQRYRFSDEAGGNGLSGDLSRGQALGEEYVSELSRVIDRGTPSRAEGFLLVIGLGGATGGGVAPELIRNLNRLTEEPVYVLGILPASTEADTEIDPAAYRPQAAANTQETLAELTGLATAIICFDNDNWLSGGQQFSSERDRINNVLVEHIAAVFGAGDVDDTTAMAQQVVDASDINRALGSDSSIATIGYATQTVKAQQAKSRFGLGIFKSKTPPEVDTSEAVRAIETVIRKAARGKQTLETTDGHADRTLLIVGGPPEWLNRQAIAQGRTWLISETGSSALLSGDAPDESRDDVFAIVLRSGVTPQNWLADRPSHH